MAEERLSTRYLRVELLSFSPRLHKIHYSQRLSHNTIKKMNENMDKGSDCKSTRDCTRAGMPHQPEVRWTGHCRADPWGDAFCRYHLMQLPPGSGVCTPKAPTAQMGENAWARKWQKHNSSSWATFSQDSCRNTSPLKTSSIKVAPMFKGWAGAERADILHYHLTSSSGNTWDGRKAWALRKETLLLIFIQIQECGWWTTVSLCVRKAEHDRRSCCSYSPTAHVPQK